MRTVRPIDYQWLKTCTDQFEGICPISDESRWSIFGARCGVSLPKPIELPLGLWAISESLFQQGFDASPPSRHLDRDEHSATVPLLPERQERSAQRLHAARACSV